MKKYILTLAILFSIIFVNNNAEAKFHFGTDDKIKVIKNAEIDVVGPDNEELELAHMYSITYFGLGVYLEDKGYVLKIKDQPHSYYNMPDAETVKEWQATKNLPDPLPEYKLEIIDYLIGYSLWIALLIIGLGYFIRRSISRGK